MASNKAAARLRQDYLRLKKNPVPYIDAEPLPNNILEWHYVVIGPESTPYEGGYYHGKLVFPKEFPFKPPSIYMITPNGRFRINSRLCLSISDFHPMTWNPSWTVSTILTGLLSFMVEQVTTMGSIISTDYDKRQYAYKSLDFNLRDTLFCELFPDIVTEMQIAKDKRAAIQGSTEIHNPDRLQQVSDGLQVLFRHFFSIFLMLFGFWLVMKVFNGDILSWLLSWFWF